MGSDCTWLKTKILFVVWFSICSLFFNVHRNEHVAAVVRRVAAVVCRVAAVLCRVAVVALLNRSMSASVTLTKRGKTLNIEM